jgi:hypothetical protein
MCKKDNQREEIAYIAGLIDGEGTIRMQKYSQKGKTWNPKYTPMIFFTNTDLEAIKLVGRFIRANIIEHVGSKNGFNGSKQCYRVCRAGAKSVIKPIETLLPFLRIKKKQAELVLKYCRNYNPIRRDGKKGNYRTDEENNFREGIYLLIKELNQYGKSRPQRLSEGTSLIRDEAIV